MGMGGNMGEGNGMAGWLTTESEEVLQTTLLPIPPVRPVDSGEDRRQVVHQLVLDPAYQLK